MGCGASSTSALETTSATEKVSQKVETTPVTTKAETKEIEKTNHDQTPKALSEADQLKQELLDELRNESDSKIGYSRVFILNFPAQPVWDLISDWNLEYLVSYSNKVSVSLGAHPKYPSVLYRSVRLPSGSFEEALLKLDVPAKAVEYVLLDGPVPFHRHFISFKITDIPSTASNNGSSSGDGSEGGSCQIAWTSYAWTRPNKSVPDARKSLEQGVVNAIEVIKQVLTTRGSSAS